MLILIIHIKTLNKTINIVFWNQIQNTFFFF